MLLLVSLFEQWKNIKLHVLGINENVSKNSEAASVEVTLKQTELGWIIYIASHNPKQPRDFLVSLNGPSLQQDYYSTFRSLLF